MTKQKFINQWLRRFASELSKENFEKYVKDQYLWHVFSQNLLPFEGLLVGDEARMAFDRAEKKDCICCDLFAGGVMQGLPDGILTASDLDTKTEFYVVSQNYTWTYIKTHEKNQFGPYFLQTTEREAKQ